MEQVAVLAAPPAPPHRVSIRPSRGWAVPDLAEVWAYRELLYFLVWRDLKVRYKQTVLGVAWVAIQPLVTAAIFALLLGRVAQLPSEGVPYPAFVLAALLPWQLFSVGLSRAGVSLVASAQLLTKVYFPRLLVPLAAVLAGLVDLGVSLLVLAGMMLWYGIAPGWAIVTAPLFVLFALLASLAVGVWLAALNVQYRDVQQAIPFLVQAWMFVSPVVYSAGVVPSGVLRTVYGLNPVMGFVQGFRWAMLGAAAPTRGIWLSLAVVLALLVSGLLYFSRVEDTFADVV